MLLRGVLVPAEEDEWRWGVRCGRGAGGGPALWAAGRRRCVGGGGAGSCVDGWVVRVVAPLVTAARVGGGAGDGGVDGWRS